MLAIWMKIAYFVWKDEEEETSTWTQKALKISCFYWLKFK